MDSLSMALKQYIAGKNLEEVIIKEIDGFMLKLRRKEETEIQHFFGEVEDILPYITESTLFGIIYIKFLKKRLLTYEDLPFLSYESKLLSKLIALKYSESIQEGQICIKDLNLSFSLQI